MADPDFQITGTKRWGGGGGGKGGHLDPEIREGTGLRKPKIFVSQFGRAPPLDPQFYNSRSVRRIAAN